jgi:hypothetical protein
MARRRDILARIASRAAARARQQISQRVQTATSGIRQGVRSRIPGLRRPEPRATPAQEPQAQERAATEQAPPTRVVEPSREPEKPTPPPPAPTPQQKVPEPQSAGLPRLPSLDDTREDEETQPEAPEVRVQASERGIELALAKLRELQLQTAEYVTQLEAIGMGDAARALVNGPELAPTVQPPPREPVAPVLPILPLEPPDDLKPQGPAPDVPTPPPPPPQKPPKEQEPPKEPPERPKRESDSPVLQGSRFYVPLMSRRDAFKVLWDAWIRAGIGKPRVTAVEGEETDAAGRLRGMVLNPDALDYLPRAEIVVPGRDGSLMVPGEIMVDEDLFNDLLDQWNIGDRITIQVEGMYRADGPVVTKSTWFAPSEPDEYNE